MKINLQLFGEGTAKEVGEETFESGTNLAEEIVENFADSVQDVGKLADDVSVTSGLDEINKFGETFDGVRNKNADFVNGSKLDIHFTKHGDDFGCNSAMEYLDKADNFLTKLPTSTTQTFVSEQGWYFRFDSNTNEFGIINPNGGISTYFKPDNGLDYWLEQVAQYGPK